MIKKVLFYQTSDGALFQNRQEADEYEEFCSDIHSMMLDLYYNRYEIDPETKIVLDWIDPEMYTKILRYIKTSSMKKLNYSDNHSQDPVYMLRFLDDYFEDAELPYLWKYTKQLLRELIKISPRVCAKFQSFEQRLRYEEVLH